MSVLFCTVCEGDDHTAYRRLVDGVTISLCPDATSAETVTALGKLGEVVRPHLTPEEHRAWVEDTEARQAHNRAESSSDRKGDTE